MTTYSCFQVSIEDKVAHLQMVRPHKRNSMVPAFWSELHEIIDSIDRKSSARAIIISSAGPVFCSGMDLSVFRQLVDGVPDDSTADKETPVPGQTSIDNAAVFYQTVTRLQSTFTRIEQCRVPVLVAVQGACLGAALALVCACDCRYATEDASFSIYEINLAMAADVGTFPAICKLMPQGLVRELAFTGRQLTAQDAMSAGLVNQVFSSHEQMLEAVRDIAALIATKAPLAVSGCKQLITHARDHTQADTLQFAALWNTGHLRADELREALLAKQENRQGRFSDLPPMVDKPGDGF